MHGMAQEVNDIILIPFLWYKGMAEVGNVPVNSACVWVSAVLSSSWDMPTLSNQLKRIAFNLLLVVPKIRNAT